MLESEKGELKKKVSKFMMVSVAYFSNIVSVCSRSEVLLQTWEMKKKESVFRYCSIEYLEETPLINTS